MVIVWPWLGLAEEKPYLVNLMAFFLSNPAHVRRRLTQIFSCENTGTSEAWAQHDVKPVNWGYKCEMIVFTAVHLALMLWGWSEWYVQYQASWAQLRYSECAVTVNRRTGCAAAYRGDGMRVSCRWLMVLPAALSLSNWPEVIWVVSIESSICNEIIDPGSAKCRDPALMQQEWWGYCSTHVSCPCVRVSWLDFGGRHRIFCNNSSLVICNMLIYWLLFLHLFLLIYKIIDLILFNLCKKKHVDSYTA